MFQVSNKNPIKNCEYFQNHVGHVFFGNRFVTKADIQKYFKTPAVSLHQIHSNILVHSMGVSEEKKADAHWTIETGLGLLIKTADCVPILFLPENQGLPIVAVHAGWRGLVSGVIQNSVKVISHPEKYLTFIGPHIRKEHFEVGRDVGEQISNFIGSEKHTYPHPDPKKQYISLTDCTKEILKNLGFSKCFVSKRDTFSDQNYPSFRRDHAGERLWSFISLFDRPV